MPADRTTTLGLPDYSADTGMKSKLAMSIFRELFKNLQEARAEASSRLTVWYPKLKMPNVFYSIYDHQPNFAWRDKTGAIYLQSNAYIAYTNKGKRVKQSCATLLFNLLLTMTEFNTMEQMLRQTKWPENMESFMVSQLRGTLEVSLKTMCCFVELLCSHSTAKLMKKYGKATVESLTLCDLNPIEMNQLAIVRDYQVRLKKTATDEIERIAKEAEEKKRQVMADLADKLAEAYGKIDY